MSVKAWKRAWRGAVIASLLATAAGGESRFCQTGGSTPDLVAQVPARLAGLPLHFEANDGRFAPDVKYMARGPGYEVFLTPRETVLSLRREKIRSVLRLSFVGSAPDSAVGALEPRVGTSRYLAGTMPQNGPLPVVHFGRIRYTQVYPGIDVEFHGSPRDLEYDFLVAPQADPRHIRVHFDGAQRLTLQASGDLHVETGAGTLVQRRPRAYQVDAAGSHQEIASRYVLWPDAADAAIEVAAYDKARPLVIDPALVYSTYLGGSALEQPAGIAADAQGNAYVLGTTYSSDFPVTSLPSAPVAPDVVLSKIAADGQTLLWSTYFQGSGADRAAEVRVDAAGNVFIGGDTTSPDFPSRDGIQPQLAGGSDAFIARLTPEGELTWSTFLGGRTGIFGDGNESLAGLAVDGSGAVYVSGSTDSSDFPTVNAAQPELAGCEQRVDPEALCVFGSNNAFVAKLAPAGDRLVYATYLATDPVTEAYGNAASQGGPIAVDASGRLFMVVSTPTYNDEFFTDQTIARYMPDGSAPVLGNTDFLFGSDDGAISASDVAIDSAGNVILLGNMFDIGLGSFQGTPGAYRETCGDAADLSAAFVAKLTPDLATTWLTALCPQAGPAGSISDLTALAMAVDASDRVYVTGTTNSALLTTDGSVTQGNDAFVLGLDPPGAAAVFVSLLGGSGYDAGVDIATDGVGGVLVAGRTASSDLRTVRPLQANAAGGGDGFVARFAPAPTAGGCATGPGTIEFAAASYSVTEDHDSVRISVKRTGGGCPESSVAYSTLAGTALPGRHFVGTDGTLRFPAGGNIVRSFVVPILDDHRYGHIQRLTLSLASPIGGILGPNSTATLGIVNVDARPAVHLSTRDRTVDSLQTVTFAVALSGPSNVDTRVRFAASGTALQGRDWIVYGGLQVVVPAGETSERLFVYQTNPPAPPGASKSLTLTLTPPANAVIGGRQSNTITIVKP